MYIPDIMNSKVVNYGLLRSFLSPNEIIGLNNILLSSDQKPIVMSTLFTRIKKSHIDIKKYVTLTCTLL